MTLAPATHQDVVDFLNHSVVQKIAESVVTGSVAASISFASIPQTFRHLALEIDARGDTAALTTNLQMQLNGDTGANYYWEYMQGFASSTSAGNQLGGTSIVPITMPGATAPAGRSGSCHTVLQNYAGSTFQKTMISMAGRSISDVAGDQVTQEVVGSWRNTAAITSILLVPQAGNLAVGTTVSLYGIP